MTEMRRCDRYGGIGTHLLGCPACRIPDRPRIELPYSPPKGSLIGDLYAGLRRLLSIILPIAFVVGLSGGLWHCLKTSDWSGWADLLILATPIAVAFPLALPFKFDLTAISEDTCTLLAMPLIFGVGLCWIWFAFCIVGLGYLLEKVGESHLNSVIWSLLLEFVVWIGPPAAVALLVALAPRLRLIPQRVAEILVKVLVALYWPWVLFIFMVLVRGKCS